MEYFFIGEREIAIGFRYVGIEGKAVYSRDDALEAFRRATGRERAQGGLAYPESEAKVLILTEEAASFLEDEIHEWQLGGSYPLLVIIPGIGGRLPGKKTLVESIREAIGIQV